MKLNGNRLDINGSYLELSKDDFKDDQELGNPVSETAFDISDSKKVTLISEKFKEIMEVLGLDLKDDSLKDTPKRVAKMYVNEVFKGLDPKNKPRITVFKNSYNYKTPLVELRIPFTSFCEHHFVPIQGVANIAYIPGDYVVGLSKLHRLVDFYARRPQVQERLTMQIFEELTTTLQSKDVGVVLKASHECISCRGVNHKGSGTITTASSGLIKSDSQVMSVLFDFS